MSFRDDARGLQDELVDLRRRLHREPEVGLNLPRTQEKVLQSISDLPLNISLGNDLSSVTAVLKGNQPGPTVLLRGDMDALPVTERTGASYAASSDRMHACGHDLHTAMLSGAARLLAEKVDSLRGDVIFMFQPGEEGYDGAGHMLREGVLDATGDKPVAAYALHVTSAIIPGGLFVTRHGPIMSASDEMYVTVRGAGGHGSMPHLARDPMPGACEMVLALQSMVTRRFDIHDPVVLTVGSFHGGTASNVITDEVTFKATIRTYSKAARATAKDECARVIKNLAAAHGLSVDFDYDENYPVTVNSDSEADFVANSVRENLGEERFHWSPHPFPGSEDFSRVIGEVPGAFTMLGAVPQGADPMKAPNNHSPLAEFDDSVLSDGAATYAQLAFERLEREPADHHVSSSAH
ncbi:M20 metallopeptidase family protein [Haloglycomyces albus]|uniref:M20 metallopeptidase family protein n=1 Tax=Haloglycomyces albus TaxID=526067 RepID=UPI00046D5C75|nr:M20 family metallopeptidase [Haloglycomyces albus]